MKKNFSGIMFIIASIGFLIAGFIGNETTFYILGVVFLAIGAGTIKSKPDLDG
ncbi:MAG: hypothetical protein GVY08_05330 [Bacteroidetes bacterium]|jgi:hypothetical protein|nr:hypothetical protein [Bacteroidota bacterium]